MQAQLGTGWFVILLAAVVAAIVAGFMMTKRTPTDNVSFGVWNGVFYAFSLIVIAFVARTGPVGAVLDGVRDSFLSIVSHTATVAQVGDKPVGNVDDYIVVKADKVVVKRDAPPLPPGWRISIFMDDAPESTVLKGIMKIPAGTAKIAAQFDPDKSRPDESAYGLTEVDVP